MENASKALIIAGAILISILLISVGILVMQSASGVTGQMETQMDQTAIRAFNAKFENYVGQKRGSLVRNLLSDVEASNVSNPDDQIAVVTSAGGTALTASAIKSTARYNITVNKNNKGLIYEIVVEEATSTSTPSTPATSV